MGRLFLFYALSAFVELAVLCAVYGKLDGESLGIVILGFVFLGSVVGFAASLVGSVVRRIAGRLRSFSAAASGAGGLAALSELLLGYTPGATLGDGAVMLLGYFVAIKCLGGSAPSRRSRSC